MKILWFSNIILTEDSMSDTGTWIKAMADSLIHFPDLELYIVSKGAVKQPEQTYYKGIKQWILPDVKLDRKGMPPLEIIEYIQEIVNIIKPDIIHVWGTEYYWSSLTAYGYIKGKVLLEMQGLIYAIADKVLADLSIKELFQCIGIKEILKPKSSIFGRQRALRKRGEIEKDIIFHHQFISTQSEWMRAHISYLNPNAKVFKTVIGLRREFLSAPKWNYERCEKNSILFITSTLSAYKGLHTLIKAFALLIKVKPEVRLYIVGPKPITGIRRPGYQRFLIKLINKEKIGDKIIWLGPLKTGELISQILKANVVVNPSFIESYSLVLREALYLGAPTVAAFVGAMPELAVHNHSALYYPTGDIALCYSDILNILNNADLASRLSNNAVIDSMGFETAKIQRIIYQSILEK